ncbi:MAG TPA: hypothetical protein VNH82_05745 [Candidatus Dormibacteraeota bacterium]|nr:hypothetical protein [Candidatus Dormibacteraeota bacterium]HVC22912.1 hypothetical protein [Candidatus Dormibacteraeota bacterium]
MPAIPVIAEQAHDVGIDPNPTYRPHERRLFGEMVRHPTAVA